MAIKIGSNIVITNSRAATFTSITGSSIDVSGNSDANQFRINGTTAIDSDRNLVNIRSISGTFITGNSIDVSGNSDANAFRINGTAVVNSSRNLTGLGSSSGALAITGTTLQLSMGGTVQDTQDLSSIFNYTDQIYDFQENMGNMYIDLGVLESEGVCFLTKWYGSCPSINDSDNCGCWTEVNSGVWRVVANGGDGTENDMGCGARCLTW